jgi:hypothetical protein
MGTVIADVGVGYPVGINTVSATIGAAAGVSSGFRALTIVLLVNKKLVLSFKNNSKVLIRKLFIKNSPLILNLFRGEFN